MLSLDLQLLNMRRNTKKRVEVAQNRNKEKKRERKKEVEIMRESRKERKKEK